MTTAAPSAPIDQRLVDAAIATLDLFGVYLGDRLGLYQVLREQPSATVGELAAAAGIHERYAQEWLEHQAVTGLLTVDDASAAPSARRYALPEAHVGALASPELYHTLTVEFGWSPDRHRAWLTDLLAAELLG